MPLEVPPSDVLPIAASQQSGRAISVILLVVSVSFAVAGQLTLKWAMDRIGRIGSAEVSEAGDTLLRAAKEPRLWLGLFLFGVSALFWLVVLSRVDLSIAYPMVGVSYILIVLFARIFLKEHVPTLRWAGVLVVAMGIAIIGLSFRRT